METSRPSFSSHLPNMSHPDYVGPCPSCGGSACDECDGDRRYRRCLHCMDDGCDECRSDEPDAELAALIDAAAAAAAAPPDQTLPVRSFTTCRITLSVINTVTCGNHMP